MGIKKIAILPGNKGKILPHFKDIVSRETRMQMEGSGLSIAFSFQSVKPLQTMLSRWQIGHVFETILRIGVNDVLERDLLFDIWWTVL